MLLLFGINDDVCLLDLVAGIGVLMEELVCIINDVTGVETGADKTPSKPTSHTASP